MDKGLTLEYLMVKVDDVLLGYRTGIARCADIIDGLLSENLYVGFLNPQVGETLVGATLALRSSMALQAASAA